MPPWGQWNSSLLAQITTNRLTLKSRVNETNAVFMDVVALCKSWGLKLEVNRPAIKWGLKRKGSRKNIWAWCNMLLSELLENFSTIQDLILCVDFLLLPKLLNHKIKLRSELHLKAEICLYRSFSVIQLLAISNI